MVEPSCSNFRVVTAIFSGVRNFRIFTVVGSRNIEIRKKVTWKKTSLVCTVKIRKTQVCIIKKTKHSDTPIRNCCNCRNILKFSDRQVWANSADPDQTAPRSLIRVYTVCHSVCIVWTHYSMVEPHISNFRVITTNFLGVRIFRKFTVS